MQTGEACAAHVSEQPFEASFHPISPLLAACTIVGTLEIFEYSTDEARRVHLLRAHTDSCRTVRFSPDGNMLLSGSADLSILATDAITGQIISRLENAHSSGINALMNISPTNLASATRPMIPVHIWIPEAHVDTPNRFRLHGKHAKRTSATFGLFHLKGDDNGTIKVWDTRQRSCVFTFDDIHEDFVADFEYNEARKELIAVSGDGTLSVHNLTRGVLEAASDNQEDELLSVVLVKNNRKAVVGSQGGIINLFTYGDWGDITDRFPGHPESVDALVKCDEETVFTGSSDGMIRIVQILPNRLLGVVGEHSDCPVERMTLSPDRKFLASASHDKTIKLWDVAYITEDTGAASAAATVPEEESSMDDMHDSGTDDEPRVANIKGKKKGKNTGASSRCSRNNDFFSDLC